MQTYFHWIGPDQLKTLNVSIEKHVRILQERKEDTKSQISKFIDQDLSKDNDYYREKMMNQVIVKLQDELQLINTMIEMQYEIIRLVQQASLYHFYTSDTCPLCKHVQSITTAEETEA